MWIVTPLGCGEGGRATPTLELAKARKLARSLLKISKA